MTYSEFWYSVLANFIPDFFVGGLIALIIALILRDKDKKELTLENSKIREQKIFDYLTDIRTEVIDIDSRIKDYQSKNDLYKYVYLYTDFWETIKSGGEIPELFNPTLMKVLSIYYSSASEINNFYDKYLRIRLSKNDYILNDIESKFKESIQSLINKNYDDLIIKIIDEGIKYSAKRLEELKKNVFPP